MAGSKDRPHRQNPRSLANSPRHATEGGTGWGPSGTRFGLDVAKTQAHGQGVPGDPSGGSLGAYYGPANSNPANPNPQPRTALPSVSGKDVNSQQKGKTGWGPGSGNKRKDAGIDVSAPATNPPRFRR